MVRRAGAREGDLVVVTGTIGDAALGLALRQDPAAAARWKLDEPMRAHLLSRYLLPQPRNALAEALRRHAERSARCLRRPRRRSRQALPGVRGRRGDRGRARAAVARRAASARERSGRDRDDPHRRRRFRDRRRGAARPPRRSARRGEATPASRSPRSASWWQGRSRRGSLLPTGACSRSRGRPTAIFERPSFRGARQREPGIQNWAVSPAPRLSAGFRVPPVAAPE